MTDHRDDGKKPAQHNKVLMHFCEMREEGLSRKGFLESADLGWAKRKAAMLETSVALDGSDNANLHWPNPDGPRPPDGLAWYCAPKNLNVIMLFMIKLY